MMGKVEYLQDSRTNAKEELRSPTVGTLKQIVDELEAMDLSCQEIESILMCGLDADSAIRMGASIRRGKETGHFCTDNLIKLTE